MTKAAAKTSAGPTFVVAIEQSFPKDLRIINDDLAFQIMPLSYRIFARVMRVGFIRDWMINWYEKTVPGTWGGMLCRKRYINEKLNKTASQVDGVVNLGAGLDTRVYTLDSISKIPIWELDQNPVIKSKEKRLTQIFGKIPDNVKNIGIDFDHEDVSELLQRNGYSSDKKIFFIWEAVTQYLEEKSVRRMFDFLSHAQKGSKIVFTYVLKDFIEGQRMYDMEFFYKREVLTKTWIFGLDPDKWPQFLEEYGWRIIKDIGGADLAEKYVKSTGRKFASTPIERMIFAEKIF
jgi:methyltransferase (TIGR00027 family)